MNIGFIKLNRSLLDWGWYSDYKTKDVFIDILLNANYTTSEYKGHTIHPGECVIGRNQMATRLGFSPQTVRTALKHLRDSGEISTIKSTNRFTIVKVEKWGLYQGVLYGNNQQDNQQTNQQLTSNQPTTNQQLTTSKKERREEGKNNNSYSWRSRPVTIDLEREVEFYDDYEATN